MLEEDFWSPEQWLGITDPRHLRGQHSSLVAHLLQFSKKKVSEFNGLFNTKDHGAVT